MNDSFFLNLSYDKQTKKNKVNLPWCQRHLFFSLVFGVSILSLFSNPFLPGALDNYKFKQLYLANVVLCLKCKIDLNNKVFYSTGISTISSYHFWIYISMILPNSSLNFDWLGSDVKFKNVILFNPIPYAIFCMRLPRGDNLG